MAVGFHPSGPNMRSASALPPLMMRSKWTEEHPSGTSPSAEKGVEKVAVSEAMIASQRVAEVTTPPTAGPFAATMIGFCGGKEFTIDDINIVRQGNP